MSAHDPLTTPVILRVAGKRFVCACGANVFSKVDGEYRCNVRAAADVIERYRVALQNAQGVALNGPPDDGIGRCDAIDQIIHEALA